MEGKNHIHLESLNAITGGDPAFTLALLKKMQTALPLAFENLRKAVESKNWPELKAAAHKVKSTFAYLDLQEMRNRMQDIEHTAMEGNDIPELPQLVHESLKTGEEILNELNQMILELEPR